MTSEIEQQLQRIAALAEKASRGPWNVDSEYINGEFGDGPDPMTGYKSFFVEDSVGNRVCDSQNAEQSIMVEHGTEEDGGSAWDQTGRVNLHFIADARTSIPRLVAALRLSFKMIEEGVTAGCSWNWEQYESWKLKNEVELIATLRGEKP